MEYLLLLLVFLTGCGKDTEIVERVVEVPAAVTTTSETVKIVQEENAYRKAAGQQPLTEGLACTLHNVAATTPSTIPNSLPSAVATFILNASFNVVDSSTSSGLPLLPDALKATYKTQYVLKCQGSVIIETSDYALFEVISDDGSKLYIDGSLLVDNDGLHSSQSRSASRLLKRGVHTFRIDYLQANGNQSLIVKMNGSVISSTSFYR